MVFASVAPSALVGSDAPITVMIDSPFNDPVVSRAAVAAFLEAGIGVGVMREISAQEIPETVIAADGNTAEQITALLAGTLGSIEESEWSNPVTGIAAAVTLGSNFVESVRNR